MSEFAAASALTPTHSPVFPGVESDVSRTLRDRCSTQGRSNKFRTPRTLTRQLQQHRDNERHRHRGLNASIVEISKRIPGHNQLAKETKIVSLQRLINYICHLETHIQSLCHDLDIDLEFKNLFLSPHISEDTKKALARQTGYDPDMVKGYGALPVGGGTTYMLTQQHVEGAAYQTLSNNTGGGIVLLNPATHFPSSSDLQMQQYTPATCKSSLNGWDKPATNYSVNLPCRNMYYSTTESQNSGLTTVEKELNRNRIIKKKIIREGSWKRSSVQKNDKTNKSSVKKWAITAKETVVVSSDSSEQDSSENDEDLLTEGNSQDMKPKCNWSDRVRVSEIMTTSELKNSENGRAIFPEPQRQGVRESGSEYSLSPPTASSRRLVEPVNPASPGGEENSPAAHPPTETTVTTDPHTADRGREVVTPTLTASQAQEGQALFHSYARPKPCRVKVKTLSVRSCCPPGPKAAPQSVVKGGGSSLQGQETTPLTGASSGEDESSSTDDGHTSCSSSESHLSPRKPHTMKELNVVEMHESDEGENCSHGDPFLSSTVLSSQAVKGAQQALKSSLDKCAAKQKVYGEDIVRKNKSDPCCHGINEIKENIPFMSFISCNHRNMNNNNNVAVIDKTPPKFYGSSNTNKRKKYTPNKIAKSDLATVEKSVFGTTAASRSPLSPIGNVLHLPEEDGETTKPLFEISPSMIGFSSSPAFGSGSLKTLLGLDEDPIYQMEIKGPEFDVDGNQSIPHAGTDEKSPGGRHSQDSGLFSQDSGFSTHL